MVKSNGVARIFFWGGPIFRDLRRPTRFGGGGGVVAEIFRLRRKPGRFSGGGGVVAEIFRDRRKPGIPWGGDSRRIFWLQEVKINQITSIPDIFLDISGSPRVTRN